MTSTGSRSLADLVATAVEVVMVGAVVLLIAGLALGLRPVILISGSMAPAAPKGSLVFVTEVEGRDVEVEDIIVIRRDIDTLITHRVVEISEVDGRRLAVTKGDANETPDPIVHEIEARQPVVRFVVPVIGSLLLPFAGWVAPLTAALAVLVALLGVRLAGARRGRGGGRLMSGPVRPTGDPMERRSADRPTESRS